MHYYAQEALNKRKMGKSFLSAIFHLSS